jgi:biotin carboxylase
MHYLILQRTSRLKFDLGDIAAAGFRQFHVVTQAENGVRLSTENWSYVSSRHHAEDWSYDAVLAAVEPLVRQFGPSATRILTHDEYSMMIAARLRDAFDLLGPGAEQVLRFTHKPTMKARMARAGVAVPRFVTLADVQLDSVAAVDRIVGVTGLPAFAKEVAGTCGERATRLDSRAEVDAWLAGTADSAEFEVDEFLTGELMHVDSIIQDGRPVHVQCSLYAYPNAEAISDRPLGSITLPYGHELAGRMRGFNEQCLHALAPLIDGTTHLEFFRTPADQFVFLEIAARSPGADCPRQYEVNSGVNFQSVFFQLQMGIAGKIDIVPGPYAAWLWYSPRDGVVTRFNQPDIKSEFDFTHDVHVGDRVSSTTDTRVRAGRIFVTNQDFDQLYEDFLHLREFYTPYEYE